MSELTTTKAGRDFLESAAYVRGNSRFDAEERDRKLEIARGMRELLETTRGGGQFDSELDAVLASLCDPRYSVLILPAHSDMLKSWAASDAQSLRRALAAFSSPHDDALVRFARWAGVAEQTPAADGVLLFGSLFNFALEPHALPFIRPTPFTVVAGRLGYDTRREPAATDRYEKHLRFVQELAGDLRRAGIEVRDMLDVQAFIFRYFDRKEYWEEGTPDLREAPAHRRPRREASDGPEPSLAIGACLGFERPYLFEWIEFHRLVGVERFFLYNNGDRETHRNLLTPYLEDGTVVLYEWPTFPPQIPAYNHCVEHHRTDSRWIAFIDTDEFLFSPTGRPLPEVLAEYEGWPGVGVNWVHFGPSGHRTKPPGMVIENYVHRLPLGRRKQIKTIVDPRQVVRCPDPHWFLYEAGYAVDENHYPITGREATAYLSTARLQLNHYGSKSEQEFRAKMETAHPSYGGARPALDFEQILDQERRCGRVDETILRYVPALREKLRDVQRV